MKILFFAISLMTSNILFGANLVEALGKENLPDVGIVQSNKKQSRNAQISIHNFKENNRPLYVLERKYDREMPIIADARVPVFLTMTTSPERIGNIEPILEKLEDLLAEFIDGIFINIPDYYRNDDKRLYDETVIGKIFQSKFSSKVIFNFIETDHGPITKILPSFERLRASNLKDAILISIDDDQYYNPECIKHLVSIKKELSSDVLTFCGGPLEHYALNFEGPTLPGNLVYSYAKQTILLPQASLEKALNKSKADISPVFKSEQKQLLNLKKPANAKKPLGDITNNIGCANKENTQKTNSKPQEDLKSQVEKKGLLLKEIEDICSNTIVLPMMRVNGCDYVLCKKELLSKNCLKEHGQSLFGMKVDIVEGQGCIAYNLNTFDCEDITLMKLLSDKDITNLDCTLSDDLIISFVLALNDKNRWNLNNPISNSDLTNWRNKCNEERILYTDGALTHGSGYSEEQKQQRHFVSDRNNDKIKYGRALKRIIALALVDDQFLDKHGLIQQLVEIKRGLM